MMFVMNRTGEIPYLPYKDLQRRIVESLINRYEPMFRCNNCMSICYLPWECIIDHDLTARNYEAITTGSGLCRQCGIGKVDLHYQNFIPRSSVRRFVESGRVTPEQWQCMDEKIDFNRYIN